MIVDERGEVRQEDGQIFEGLSAKEEATHCFPHF